jgi:hypothetical protein
MRPFDATGKQIMGYFEPNTGWPEQLGKIMGDAFAAAMIIFVVVLVLVSFLR